MKELKYLSDSYAKAVTTTVRKAVKKGDVWHVFLNETVVYPEGGGQPSDTATLTGTGISGKVVHAVMTDEGVLHECRLDHPPKAGDKLTVSLDWDRRYRNMRLHSAGHVVHEAVMSVKDSLMPLNADHAPGDPHIAYQGELPVGKCGEIERVANGIIARNVQITTEFVSFEELVKRVQHVPGKLPRNKPLRIMQIEGCRPVPDGGTQVGRTGEIGLIAIDRIENDGNKVRVFYRIQETERQQPDYESGKKAISAGQLVARLIALEQDLTRQIAESSCSREELKIRLLGPAGEFAEAARMIKDLPRQDRAEAGIVMNQVKAAIAAAIENHKPALSPPAESFDPTVPGILPPTGHLHIVSQAITEITDIFARIGFTRVRHPEVDWDRYAFEALNMPPDHPARDEWETFFIDYHNKRNTGVRSMVLTPHTSNGQVREMEKGNLPIRMINIAKCYRRQMDVSHTEMFHQFEGLYVDENVSIAHLKGVISFFVRNYYGPKREIRLRPFHFQFTEPSFEIDITCGICLGSGKLADGSACRLCKSGWLELGGAGMVHPNVLKAGNIDTGKYNGFAFGWGVERTFMMKSGTKISDIRLIYDNDIRFLEQF